MILPPFKVRKGLSLDRGSAPWLHMRITWGALARKKIPYPDSTLAMSQDLGLDLGIDFCKFPRQFSCAARVRKLALGVLVTSGQASLLPSLPPGGRSLEPGKQVLGVG